MEEVDKIIIDSLKHINCDIDEDINSLKQFEPDLVLKAISSCLAIINPGIQVIKKLPASMSGKIKLASNVAQQIRTIGFKGDMGYQTILYSNEVEVRRVLMFLIERLPKEASPVTTIEPVGYVARIVKDIEDSLKRSLNSMWLPTALLHYGTRQISDNIIVNSLGNSSELNSVNLILPSAENREYIPEVPRQCTKKQLLPSLLFKPADFTNCSNWENLVQQRLIKTDITDQILDETSNDKYTESTQIESATEEAPNTLKTSIEHLKIKKNELVALQESVNSLEKELKKVQNENLEEEKHLKEITHNTKILSTTLAVLYNEENKIKLTNSIEKAKNRLADLRKKWDEVQSPLLEEHKALKSLVSSESIKNQNDGYKYKNLKQTYANLVRDFKEKDLFEAKLVEKCKEIGNKNNRAAYTKRILEIVANIKKQNHEIEKVLLDTKDVQKDINSLTGQIDRSFTLSDELIFYDCKQDETARKAYKFLAALREECNGVLQAVSDMGQTERELRNLEEQIESEKSKGVKEKLEKIQKDLEEIQKEIKLLS